MSISTYRLRVGLCVILSIIIIALTWWWYQSRAIERRVDELIDVISSSGRLDTPSNTISVFEAVYILGELQQRAGRAVPALLKLVNESDSIHRRVSAAIALGKIGDASAAGPIKTLLADATVQSRSTLRKAVENALKKLNVADGEIARIGSKPPMPDLIQAALDEAFPKWVGEWERNGKSLSIGRLTDRKLILQNVDGKVSHGVLVAKNRVRIIEPAQWGNNLIGTMDDKDWKTIYWSDNSLWVRSHEKQ